MKTITKRPKAKTQKVSFSAKSNDAPKDKKTQDPFYCAANMERLRKSVKAAKEGKLTPHELIEE